MVKRRHHSFPSNHTHTIHISCICPPSRGRHILDPLVYSRRHDQKNGSILSTPSTRGCMWNELTLSGLRFLPPYHYAIQDAFSRPLHSVSQLTYLIVYTCTLSSRFRSLFRESWNRVLCQYERILPRVVGCISSSRSDHPRHPFSRGCSSNSSHSAQFPTFIWRLFGTFEYRRARSFVAQIIFTTSVIDA